MREIGSSADNAAAESFNAAFERETLKGRKACSSEREARRDAFRWLTRHNTRRRHSRLAQLSPTVYENDVQPAATTLAQAAWAYSKSGVKALARHRAEPDLAGDRPDRPRPVGHQAQNAKRSTDSVGGPSRKIVAKFEDPS